MLCFALSVQAAEFIAVSSTAREDYIRPVGADGQPQPSSYVFMKGHFLNGNAKDGSLERMPFMDIARILAPDLAKRNFFPATEAKTAELTIVVHWGATSIYENPRGELDIEELNQALADSTKSYESVSWQDPAAANAVMDKLSSAQSSTAGTIDFNAKLLGFSGNLEKERRRAMPTTEEWRLSTELNEERYFVILMAYDRQPVTKGTKARLLWVTRLSVRGPGTNFTESLPALSQVGGQTFGQQLDGLARVKGSWKGGKVILHEMKVLSVADESEDKKNK